MPDARGVVALVLLAAGVGFMVDAARRGAASAALVLIFPVLSGNSPEFLVGFLVFVIGLLLGLLALGGSDRTFRPSDLVGSDDPRSGSGAVVLIGPVPIFFGSARPASRRALLAWVAVGAALTVATVLVLLYFV